MSIAIIIAVVFILLFGFVVAFGAPYVPTKRSELKRAFDSLYDFKPTDLLVDIGSGDGVILREVSRRGARAVGYEINPFLVIISRLLSRGDERVKTVQANLWKARFPMDTTVVYLFGESRDIKKMTAKIQQEATRVKRELAVISYGFELFDLRVDKQEGAHFLYRVKP